MWTKAFISSREHIFHLKGGCCTESRWVLVVHPHSSVRRQKQGICEWLQLIDSLEKLVQTLERQTDCDWICPLGQIFADLRRGHPGETVTHPQRDPALQKLSSLQKNIECWLKIFLSSTIHLAGRVLNGKFEGVAGNAITVVKSWIYCRKHAWVFKKTDQLKAQVNSVILVQSDSTSTQSILCTVIMMVWFRWFRLLEDNKADYCGREQ